MVSQRTFPEIRFILLGLALLTAPFAVCGKKASSHWSSGEITIDGDATEWKDRLTYYEKQDLSLAMANDGKYLYVCLVVESPETKRKLMGMGTVLWLDSSGGKKKEFGIRYPLGMRGGEQRTTRQQARDEDGSFDRGKARKAFDSSLTDLEILGPEKEDRKRLILAEVPGIEAKIFSDRESMVYELKVPLAKSETTPYAIGSAVGAEIGVGIVTPTRKQGQRQGRRGGPGGRGGGPGSGGGKGGGSSYGGNSGGSYGGGGRGGSGRGGGGGQRSQMPKPVKLWLQVNLSTQ